jgi:signal peptidase I
MQSKHAEARYAALRLLAGAALAMVLVACGWCYGVLFIEGGSMAPAVRAGDVVLYRRVAPRLARGDLVVFEHGGTLVVHRVAGVLHGGRLRTRGDANGSIDPMAVEATDVRGEVVLVVPFGAVAARLAGSAH